MTFAKKGTYGVPEFAGTEVNRRSGNLKGLGVPAYISQKKTHLRPASPAGISTTRWSEHKQPRHDGRGSTDQHKHTQLLDRGTNSKDHT